jgi:hypothetical protein
MTPRTRARRARKYLTRMQRSAPVGFDGPEPTGRFGPYREPTGAKKKKLVRIRRIIGRHSLAFGLRKRKAGPTLYVAIAFRSLFASLLPAWRKAATIINKKTCGLHRTRPASGPSQSRARLAPSIQSAPLEVRKSQRTTRRLDSHHASHRLELLVLLVGYLAPSLG